MTITGIFGTNIQNPVNQKNFSKRIKTIVDYIYCETRFMNINVINRTSTQKVALKVCEEKRPQFTRVSPIWLDKLNKDVILLIEDRILHNTSKQKTLR